MKYHDVGLSRLMIGLFNLKFRLYFLDLLFNEPSYSRLLKIQIKLKIRFNVFCFDQSKISLRIIFCAAALCKMWSQNSTVEMIFCRISSTVID